MDREQEERVSCSIDEQIKEAQRELTLRQNFYKKQVARQLMTEELAQYRIELMQAILQSLRVLQAPVPELQDCKPLVLYFPTDAARDEFVAAIQQALPNMTPRSL